MPDLSGFFSFLMIILILFAAYISTRWYATKVKSMTTGKHIKIVDRVILGKDKGLLIVKVGQNLYLMSESASGLTILHEVEEEELSILENPAASTSFKDILQSYLGYPHNDNTVQNPMDNLLDLKNKVSNSLNRMTSRHKGEEKANDEREEI